MDPPVLPHSRSALFNRLVPIRRPLIIATHVALIVASSFVSLWLRFDGNVPPLYLASWWAALPLVVVVRGACFAAFRLYEGLWRYTSMWDLRRIVLGVLSSSVLLYLILHVGLHRTGYPRSVFIIDSIVLICLMVGIRLTRRVSAEFSRHQPGTRVLVFGAGDAGELIVRDMKNRTLPQYRPIGFIDDDGRKVGLRIHGVPVLGTRQDVTSVIRRHAPDELLLAVPSADPSTVRSLVRLLEPFKLPIKTLPSLRDIMDGKVEVGGIRSLALDDLLARAPVGLDARPLQYLITGHRVMVTGAGGSIGSELCRQIAKLKPAAVVMVDRYENSLHAIRLELEDSQSGIRVCPVIADVTDAARVEDVLQRYEPEIVFHAAAHKHVPLMEENPCEAIKNNVQGTRVLVDAAALHGVDRFVFISTDKAVNPTSMMGSSKRLAELVIQCRSAQESRTSFSIVRFGNVLGSNGSVLPRFVDQIRRGGPVTVTHPEMRRYFMSIPEAVQLVLHAAAQAEHGATYVLEMGEQIKLVDMARDLIRLSGFVHDVDIKIEFTGIRPGEKLVEELVGEREWASPSRVEKILCVRTTDEPTPALLSEIDEVVSLAARGRTADMLAAVRRIVGDRSTVVRAEGAMLAGSASEGGEAGGPSPDRCPNCGGQRVRRSRAKGLRERIQKQLTGRRLHRCESCGWRGWRPPPPRPDGPAPHGVTADRP